MEPEWRIGALISRITDCRHGFCLFNTGQTMSPICIDSCIRGHASVSSPTVKEECKDALSKFTRSDLTVTNDHDVTCIVLPCSKQWLDKGPMGPDRVYQWRPLPPLLWAPPLPLSSPRVGPPPFWWGLPLSPSPFPLGWQFCIHLGMCMLLPAPEPSLPMWFRLF